MGLRFWLLLVDIRTVLAFLPLVDPCIVHLYVSLCVLNAYFLHLYINVLVRAAR
jgi:hypothetical protein